jgi:hypothetical protein
MLPYYAAGLAVLCLALAASVQWGAEYPIVQVAAFGVCTYVGKLIGVPLEKVLLYSLQKRPEQAVAIAMQAIQSMPPERAEAATKELISSIPPAAIQRVVLVNTTEPPPSASTPPS